MVDRRHVDVGHLRRIVGAPKLNGGIAFRRGSECLDGIFVGSSTLYDEACRTAG